MATRNQLSSIIFNHVTGALKAVTNYGFSLLQVEDEMDFHRAELLETLARSKPLHSAGLMQTLPEIPLLPKEETAAPLLGLRTMAAPKQVKHAVIPPVLTITHLNPVQYCGTTSGQKPYRVRTSGSYRYATYATWTAMKPLVLIDNHSLWVYSWQDDLPDHLRLEAVFRQPALVEEYLDDDTLDYPLPEMLIPLLIERMTRVYIQYYYRLMAQPNTQADLPTGSAPAK